MDAETWFEKNNRSDKMNVLHCPYNIANQATVVTRFQKRKGLDTKIIVFHDKHGFGSDWNLNCHDKSLACLAKITKAIANDAMNSDIIHYYYDTFLKTKLSNNRDMKLLKNKGKKIIFQFCGCDARLDCHICDKPLCNTRENIKRIENAKKHADSIIYPIPELIKETGEWVPYAIDLDYHKPQPDPGNTKVTVLHAPTNTGIKGTKTINTVVGSLNVDYIHLMGVPYEKMRDYYARADIIVDQLHTEWYGTMAAEVMAMGKPVLSPIAPELESYADKCPVVRVTPENLERQLRMLVEDETLRKKLGKAGRKYAERVHDAKKITERIVKMYD